MEADPTGGTNYTVSGTSQLLSVPYALYAKSAGSSISSIIHTRAYVGSANQLLFSIAEQENPTEPFVQLPITRQGKLKNLFIYPAGFTPTSGCSVTATIRVNGSDSPLNVIHSSNNGNSVTSNTSTEVSVSPGDLISVKILETNGVAPQGVYRITFELH
jgi:predicted metal-dependent enzyme (double-stranded beta helix superfamily)